MVVKKKKTAKVEPVDLEEAKLQMLIGNITHMPFQKVKNPPPKHYMFCHFLETDSKLNKRVQF